MRSGYPYSCIASRSKKWWLSIAILLGLFLGACGGGGNSSTPTPKTAAIKSMVSFGDSLSDAGTHEFAVNTATGLVSGRFTTNPGTIWVQNLAIYYGVALTPYRSAGLTAPTTILGGTDYAEGGARVTDPNGVDGKMGKAALNSTTGVYAGLAAMPLAEQVATHLKRFPAFPADQLVTILGGANDILYQAAVVNATVTATAAAGGDVVAAQTAAVQAAQSAVQQAALDFVNLVKTIANAGAKTILVANLPDLGDTPQFRGTSGAPLANGLTLLFNGTVAQGLVGVAGVVQMDTFTLLKTVLANPASYGFSNTTSVACTNTLPSTSSLFCTPVNWATVSADQTYVFADTVHPTTHMHKVFSDSVIARLSSALP